MTMVPDHVTMADDHVTVAPGHVTMAPDIVTLAPGHVTMAPDHVGTWVFGQHALHVIMTLGSQMLMYNSALTVEATRPDLEKTTGAGEDNRSWRRQPDLEKTIGAGEDNRSWRRQPELEKTTVITRLKVRLHLRKARQERG